MHHQEEETYFRLLGVEIPKINHIRSSSHHSYPHLDHFFNHSTNHAPNPSACAANTTHHSKLMAITAHDSSLISPKTRHCHVLSLDNDNAKKFKGKEKVLVQDEQHHIYNHGSFLLFGVQIHIPKSDIQKVDTYSTPSTSSTVTNAIPLRMISARPLNRNAPWSQYFERFYNYITTNLGGDNVTLILQKSLQMTDCDVLQSRLSLPRNHLLTKQFLTESEEEWLNMKDQHTGKLNTLPVIVIDPCLNIWDVDRSLHISKWNYYQKTTGRTPGCSYALKTNWNKLKIHNNLKQNDIIQVWSFRVQGKLGLALIGLL